MQPSAPLDRGVHNRLRNSQIVRNRRPACLERQSRFTPVEFPRKRGDYFPQHPDREETTNQGISDDFHFSWLSDRVFRERRAVVMEDRTAHGQIEDDEFVEDDELVEDDEYALLMRRPPAQRDVTSLVGSMRRRRETVVERGRRRVDRGMPMSFSASRFAAPRHEPTDRTDENYRALAAVEALRSIRDCKMRIIDTSFDDFVIPYPTRANYMKGEENEPLRVPNSKKMIDEYIEDRRHSSNVWSDPTEAVDLCTVDEVIAARAGNHANKPQEYSTVLHFTQFPPKIVPRENDTLLRPVLIDGCAVVHQVNNHFNLAWVSTDSIETYEKDKLLLMKPIVHVVLRFLLMGHKVTVLLPDYYSKPVFAGRSKKVDDLRAFECLRSNGLVEFLAQSDIPVWWDSLLKKVDQLDGCFVSSTVMKRMLNQDDLQRSRPSSPNHEEGTARETVELTDCRPVDRMLTPYFITFRQVLVCPMDVSAFNAEHQRITINAKRVLNYGVDSKCGCDLRLREQLSFAEQIRKVTALYGLFELSPWEIRGVELRLLQEARRTLAEETSRMARDAVAQAEFGQEVLRAWGSSLYNDY